MTDPSALTGLVARFVDNACPDHHVRGRQDHRRAEATALRLLKQHPEIAGHDLATAIVCGDIDTVRATLERDPQAAARPIGLPAATRAKVGGANDLYHALGPKGWTPLLHLAFTRLPLAPANENAIAIARLLLEHGADPNAYFHAGDSRYTPMVGVIGEGEEDRPPHPHRDELAQLLLDFGAEPYDIQVVYNLGFHADYLWWLPRIHARSVAIGRANDWNDPQWSMLDMGGYGCGARWMLEHAIRHAKPDLADWCLAHGAGANAPPAAGGPFARGSLLDAAVEAGQYDIAELLERHGAQRIVAAKSPAQGLSEAAFRLDRHAVQQWFLEQPSLRDGPALLFLAADRNRADVIALLVDCGVSPNVADEKNTRALNRAAMAGAAAAVATLLKLGAEVDAVEGNYGGTAFGNAAHFLHREVMDLLAPLTRDVWNLVYNGYLDRLREVLTEDSSRARVDWDTWSPLLWLPPHDEELALATAQLLVEHGADPHKRDSSGASPADRAEAIAMTHVAEWLRTAAT